MDDYGKYRKNYSDDRFRDKVRRVAKKAGVKVIYVALLLYYVLRNPATPSGQKARILGALGYFILPTDLIADFLPAVGFTDDLAVLTWALCSLTKFVTPEVKIQARQKLGEWFPDDDQVPLEDL